jgi:hypothetical protein
MVSSNIVDSFDEETAESLFTAINSDEAFEFKNPKGYEIGVLKEAEGTEADDDTDPQRDLGDDRIAPFVDDQTHDVVDQDGRHHEDGVNRFAVEVEEQAGNEKHEVLRLEIVVFAVFLLEDLELKRQYKIDCKHSYQKVEKKAYT